MVFSVEQSNEFGAFAQRLADAARGQTLPRFRSQALRNSGAVINKTEIVDGMAAGGDFDPVTEADREAERVMRGLIGRTYPDHGIIGEEFSDTGRDNPRRWVLDPVDGTRAFVCGVASWTTLIALESNQKAVLGLIDQPFTDERWLAVDGRATYRRGDAHMSCGTSGFTDLSKARISTTDPRPTAYFSKGEAAAFERLAMASRLVRFSMDAYAYGLLAIGELDLVVESGLKHHDYASLGPIIEGAGGIITNWLGEPIGSDDRGEVLAAATPALHAAAMEILNAS